MQRFLLLFLLLMMTPQLTHAQVLEVDPALEKKTEPPKQASSSKIILKGSVTTLENAIIQEKDRVDWYQWYLSCRTYLAQSGGFACPIGTLIQFNKNGTTQTNSTNPVCIQSVISKRFPLPKTTQLRAVILPVRSGAAPPAPPSELYRYISPER